VFALGIKFLTIMHVCSTVVDIRTIVGTPTYPYSFLVGHEDPDMVHRLRITAFSNKALVIPNVCCSQTPQFTNTGGITLDMEAFQPTADLAFVVGQLKAKARKTTIVIRPAPEMFGDVKLTLRITDGNITALSTITIFVNNRPQLDKFCAYDVLEQDSLANIADMYGMHWMTLFMMNGHTLTHPDNLTPGTRLSIGRPYIVKKSDSLYRCLNPCIMTFLLLCVWCVLVYVLVFLACILERCFFVCLCISAGPCIDMFVFFCMCASV